MREKTLVSWCSRGKGSKGTRMYSSLDQSTHPTAIDRFRCPPCMLDMPVVTFHTFSLVVMLAGPVRVTRFIGFVDDEVQYRSNRCDPPKRSCSQCHLLGLGVHFICWVLTLSSLLDGASQCLIFISIPMVATTCREGLHRAGYDTGRV